MTNPLEITMYERLAEPFPTESVHWRVGSTNKRNFEAKKAKQRKGKPLAYLDARDVQDRLDTVCGPENWQDEYINAGNGLTCCRIGIMTMTRFPGMDYQWIWKADGAGPTDFEGPKGGFSDAFKRAAVKHGIGRYLYGCDSPWIELDEWWNIPKGARSDLEKSLEKAGNQELWGDRNAYNTYRLLSDALKAFTSEKQVQDWIEGNKGIMAQLKVGAKRELDNELNRLCASFKKEAAE